MKKYIPFFIALLSFQILLAQTDVNKVGFGFNINRIQNDFGIGVDIITPYFASSKLAIKIGTNVKWLEHIQESIMTWTPYQNVQIGIRSRHFIIEDKFFIYGEGGSLILFPNSQFSSKKSRFGGYGVFGFEFKGSSHFGFYLELGAAGSGAKADLITHEPIYSNGFITNVGFRIIP